MGYGDPNVTNNINAPPREAEAAAVAGIVREAEKAKASVQLQTVKDSQGRSAELLFLPVNIAPHSVKKYLDEYATRPDRKKGSLTCEDLQSFIASVRLHARPSTVLFASATARKLEAIFDYHEPNAGQADWLQHRAVYPFPITPEWNAWADLHNKWITQSHLAAFLEDHAVDVVEPARAMDQARLWTERLGIEFAAPARMMGLSRGLAVTVDTKVEEARNLGTGEATLRFEQSHNGADGKPLSVPGALLIEVPIFRGGAAYQLPARLRYRVGKEKAEISWQISLYRADLALQDAVKEVCETARHELALPLLYGTPEA